MSNGSSARTGRSLRSADEPVTAAAVANAAAAAALACPDVVALHHGAVGEFATYALGQRIPGVVVGSGSPPSVVVQLVARYGPSLHATADDVRRAVGEALDALDPALRSAPVEVSIADVADGVQR